MTLHAFTARVSYRGADRLDITRKSAVGDGLVFAPSWEILRPALDARRKASELRAKGKASPFYFDGAEAESVESRAWEQYVPAYTAEMRAGYVQHRDAWERLLARDVVTLCCYCADARRCHRTVLARDILPTLGATYAGELP